MCRGQLIPNRNVDRLFLHVGLNCFIAHRVDLVSQLKSSSYIMWRSKLIAS